MSVATGAGYVTTVSAAQRLMSAGQAAGLISVKVAALAEGVVKTMFVPKLKAAVSIVALLAALATGATLLTLRPAAGQEERKSTGEKPMGPPANQGSKVSDPDPKQGKAKEELTAWGKEAGGLQAGLGYQRGEKRVHHPGETVTLVVRVRNVGKQDVSFQHLRHFFIENPPTVTDDQGKAVALKDGSPRGIYKPVDETLAPGKEIELYQLSLTLSDKAADTPQASTLYGEGRFQLQYERILGDSMLTSVSIKTDPALRTLATGKLDLVVSRWIARAAPVREKKPLTAWGKAEGSLQVGLGFRAGEDRDYRPGESAILVLRVRNVSRGESTFVYSLEDFWEHPPSVVDDKGKAVVLKGVPSSARALRTATMKAGEEVDLCQFDLVLQPPSDKGENSSPWTLYEVGALQVQYKDVGLLAATGEDAGTKATTGKLPLVIKDAGSKGSPGPKQDPGATFNPVDSQASLQWFRQRAVAIQNAGDNGNELAAKVLSERTTKEVRDAREVDWLVPVSHIGPDEITLGGPSEIDNERRLEYSIRLTRRPAQDLPTVPEDQLRKLEGMPTPRGDWVLALKKGDLVRVKGKVADGLLRVDQKLPVGILWVSLEGIEITPAEGRPGGR